MIAEFTKKRMYKGNLEKWRVLWVDTTLSKICKMVRSNWILRDVKADNRITHSVKVEMHHLSKIKASEIHLLKEQTSKFKFLKSPFWNVEGDKKELKCHKQFKFKQLKATRNKIWVSLERVVFQIWDLLPLNITLYLREMSSKINLMIHWISNRIK